MVYYCTNSFGRYRRLAYMEKKRATTRVAPTVENIDMTWAMAGFVCG